MRGSRWVPPSISGTPQRRSGKPSAASGVAIRRSHQSASSSPPARHQPEIAAIVGLEAISRVKPSGPSARVQPRAEASRSPSGRRRRRRPRRRRRSGPSRARRRPPRSGGSASAEQLGGRAVHRVAPLLAVDRHDRGGAAPLVGHRVASARTLPERRVAPAGSSEPRARGGICTRILAPAREAAA